MRQKGSMMISNPASKYFVATSQYLLPTAVIALSIATLYLTFFSSFFKVTKIDCYQDVGEPCQNGFLLKDQDRFIGKNIFLLDTAQEVARLKKGDPTIRSIDYTKTLPGQLTLQIQSVYPTLALGTLGSDNLLILDSDYRLIKSSQVSFNVPVISYDKELTIRVGERIENEELRALLNACLKIATKVTGTTTFSLKDKSITADLPPGGTQALFTITRDLDEQLSALHTIREGVTISPSGTVIDVRYLQPIIKDSSSL